MNAPLTPSIERGLRMGARRSGAHDADLDGVIEVRMDWERAPLFQVLLEAQHVRVSGSDRRQLFNLIGEAKCGLAGAESDLRALLMRVA